MLKNHNQQIYKLKRAQQILKILKHKGFEAFIVGGAVRDFCLNIPLTDIDITTNATSQNIKNIFSLKMKNNKYGSHKIIFEKEIFDITTYRKEGSYLDHRHPSFVEFINDVKQDILRRDFTINGLLMNEENHIIDYIKGKDDLLKGLIRAIANPDQKFKEDALRIIKLFYLQAKLNFSIEKNTYQAIFANVCFLKKLNSQDLFREIKKMLKQPYVYQAFVSMVRTKAVNFLNGLKPCILFIIKNKIFNLNQELFLNISFTLDPNFGQKFFLNREEKKMLKHLSWCS
ncbi:MAG: CCA tRNA nucleotidyltransferase [Vigna little leaf phytoplasma]|nr:CCA tRNA nucleotidyltransferase [Vigna little leaf phytoplasma]